MKARELYRDIARERMNTLGPIYQTTAHGHRILNLMRWPTCWSYCARTLKKILISGGIKSAIWKKEVRTPGNEAETWDSSPTSLGPVHLDIKQDSSSIWGCHTPTPINASTGCLWNQPLWIFSWHFFDLKEYRQQNIIVYLCLYLLFSDRQTHTLIMNNVSTSFPESPGDELFLWGGRGRGLLCSSFLRQWQC